MKYLKSFKKSEVGSSNFYSNKDIVFSNYSTEVPYGVLTAIEDSNNGGDNNITIKYLWNSGSNSITVYGQSNGSNDYSDFYLEAVAPLCVAIVSSNNVDYKSTAQLGYFRMDVDNIPNFGDNSLVKKLALHEGVSVIDANYISNGVNIDPQYSNGFGNLEALYLMNTNTAVTIDYKPNSNFARYTDLYVPSNLSVYYSSSAYEGFKSVNYF